ncbi:hypothetical protein HQN90_34955 [Paenibacillus alba]|uniref:hypothetical protein n=1 Tax=Paenibacillus alba TaxID=1197127 RepID=UPI0015644979|nr:hypothetical protein [Paenibacillus alba]NQX71297.1 hypothetical protein [Paenibacillus alba]
MNFSKVAVERLKNSLKLAGKFEMSAVGLKNSLKERRKGEFSNLPTECVAERMI